MREGAIIFTIGLVGAVLITDVSRAGAEARRVLQATSAFPAWSLDGTTLVCTHLDPAWDDTVPPQVWTVPLDGSPPDTLITDPRGAVFPQWLLDGERLAYFNGRQFVIVDPDVGDRTFWAEPVPRVFEDAGMAMTPDGKLLYTNANLQTWALDPDTGANSFVHAQTGAVISPDAQFIAYTDTEDTLEVARIGQGPTISLGRGFFPSWTSDSRHLVYTGIGPDSEMNLYLANREGTFQQQLTDDPEQELWPRVSPVQNSVAYTRPLFEESSYELWVLDFEIPPYSVQSRTWSQIKNLYRGK